MRKLYFTIGISGSGKSYYFNNSFLYDFSDVAKILTEKGLTLADIKVCPDDIRREVCGDVSDMSRDSYVWKLAEKRVKENLDEYGLALFDAVGAGKSRKKFLKKFNADKIALVFKPDAKLSISRITNDINEGVDRSKVPAVAVYGQLKAFKNNVINDPNWDGIWSKTTENKINEKLDSEFKEVFFV